MHCCIYVEKYDKTRRAWEISKSLKKVLCTIHRSECTPLMRITPIKKTILEELAKESQPKKPKDIAKKLGLNFSSCMMHILGLKKAGYVSSPKRGYYELTDRGTAALKPKSSLTQLSPEKGFYFYTGINQYSGLHANSLLDFCEKLKIADPQSVKFHIARRDFERWLESLGDRELARKLGAIREKGASGEELRRLVYEAAKSRCDELNGVLKVSQPVESRKSMKEAMQK